MFEPWVRELGIQTMVRELQNSMLKPWSGTPELEQWIRELQNSIRTLGSGTPELSHLLVDLLANSPNPPTQIIQPAVRPFRPHVPWANSSSQLICTCKASRRLEKLALPATFQHPSRSPSAAVSWQKFLAAPSKAENLPYNLSFLLAAADFHSLPCKLLKSLDRSPSLLPPAIYWQEFYPATKPLHNKRERSPTNRSVRVIKTLVFCCCWWCFVPTLAESDKSDFLLLQHGQIWSDSPIEALKTQLWLKNLYLPRWGLELRHSSNGNRHEKPEKTHPMALMAVMQHRAQDGSPAQQTVTSTAAA